MAATNAAKNNRIGKGDVVITDSNGKVIYSSLVWKGGDTYTIEFDGDTPVKDIDCKITWQEDI